MAALRPPAMEDKTVWLHTERVVIEALSDVKQGKKSLWSPFDDTEMMRAAVLCMTQTLINN